MRIFIQILAALALWTLPGCTATISLFPKKGTERLSVVTYESSQSPVGSSQSAEQVALNVLNGCEEYVKPAPGKLPVLPTLTDEELDDKDAVSIKLAQHIAELRAFAVSEQLRHDRAYEEYRLSCRQP